MFFFLILFILFCMCSYLQCASIPPKTMCTFILLDTTKAFVHSFCVQIVTTKRKKTKIYIPMDQVYGGVGGGLADFTEQVIFEELKKKFHNSPVTTFFFLPAKFIIFMTVGSKPITPHRFNCGEFDYESWHLDGYDFFHGKICSMFSKLGDDACNSS